MHDFLHIGKYKYGEAPHVGGFITTEAFKAKPFPIDAIFSWRFSEQCAYPSGTYRCGLTKEERATREWQKKDT